MRNALLFLLLAGAAGVMGLARPHHFDIARGKIAQMVPGLAPSVPEPSLAASPWAIALIEAAASQIGTTTIYDGSYAKLAFPGGDVPRERGVCTDVVIRALRDAHRLDLQELVNADMKAAFSAYPQNWGLTRPDPNIDHRRVPNLRRFFERAGTALPHPGPDTRFLPGDVVTWVLAPGVPHIGIVSDRAAPGSDRPLIIHNVGAGARIEDVLFDYVLTGHYRLEGKL